MKKKLRILGILIAALFAMNVSYGQIDIDSLYMVGDATMAGWNISNPVPLNIDETDTSIFVWKGELTVGDIKFPAFKGDWCDGRWFVADTANHAPGLSKFVTYEGCVDSLDNKWTITEAGTYQIIINLNDSTVRINQFNLYLVGSASPSGWNISDPTAMAQNETNKNVYSWEGPLVAGELKFSTFKGDWCDGNWLLATEANQGLAATGYRIYSGCPPGEEDIKWSVTSETAGNYLITIDLDANIITFELQTTNVYSYEEDVQIMYPNPVVNTFFISMQANGNLEIINVAGVSMRKTNLVSGINSIDVTNLNNGIYIIKIITENNETITKRAIVNK